MDAHTDWQRFAKDRAARLMIWQTNEADAQLVQLYFQTQEEMSSAVIVMRSDFVAGAHYAPALTDELIRFYDSRRDASNAQGLRADWQPPRDDGGHSVLRFLSVVDSLMQHHPDIFPAMVFALQPAQVRDDAALARWLGEWLHVIETSPRLGARVRFVLRASMPSRSSRCNSNIRAPCTS